MSESNASNASNAYGALVALRLAAMHQERVRSVAAVSTADRITPRIWKETAEMREIALGGRGRRRRRPGARLPAAAHLHRGLHGPAD